MIWIANELPPEIPPACIAQAASHYAVPEIILLAVLKVEGGKLGKEYARSTGTYYGPFQISNKWLSHFSKWGFTSTHLQHDACSNVTAAAYILAYYQVRERDWVRAIARYNVGSLNTLARVEAGNRYVTKVLAQWGGIHLRLKRREGNA